MTQTCSRKCSNLFKRYDQVLRAPGEKYFELKHTATPKRQREGGLARSAEVDQAVFTAALDWRVDDVE